MNFRGIAPDPVLAPFIEGYSVIFGEHCPETTIHLPPKGGVSLMLNLGDGPHSSRFERRFDERALLVGAMTGGDRQTLGGHIHLLVINFKPGAFTHVHRDPHLDRVANTVQPVEPSWFPEPDAVVKHGAPLLDRFYRERLVQPRTSLLPVIADIEQHRGQVRIDDLMRRHATTARQLERLFKQQVGLTPKAFIGLTRFNHAFGVVQREEGRRSLMEIAWDCGYYDHAHLANDFERRLGASPSTVILSGSSKAEAARAR